MHSAVHGGFGRLPAGDDPRCSGVRRLGTEDPGTGSQDFQLGGELETLYAGIQDSLFGFRVYPIAPLIAVMRQTRWMRRFDFDAEAVVRLSWRGIPVINLPAPVRYFAPAEGGISHFHYWRDNVLLTSMHLRLFLKGSCACRC